MTAPPLGRLRPSTWVRIYSAITWVAVIYGAAAAHVPFLMGRPWTTCLSYPIPLYCALTFHLFDVPLLFFNAYVAWFGLARYRRNVALYTSLLAFSVAANLAFFTFETLLLMETLRRGAPAWEGVVLASVALILLGGAGLAVYVHHILLAAAADTGRLSQPPIPRGDDGFFHPVNEDQIVALVRYARRAGLKIRCRGAAHSVAWAIYTDQTGVNNGVSQQDPPQSPNVNLMLDKYNRLIWIDEAKGIIEVETGIHLGFDPEDPTHASTSGRGPLNQIGLLRQISLKGWALEDLGGITHQTVGGFLSTGSAGGSLIYDLGKNLAAFRVIDGTGNVRWVEKQSDPDAFNALGVSLGLLGIISKVRFELTPNYDIHGEQTIVPIDPARCPIDLFGPGGQTKPSVREYLEQTPYTRLLWWPQQGVERVTIWWAQRRTPVDPERDTAPYYEFAKNMFLAQVEQIFGAILFTLLGNRGFFRTWGKLQRDFSQGRRNIAGVWGKKVGGWLGGTLAWLFSALVYLVGLLLVLVFSIVRPLLLWLYPKLIDMLQPLTKAGKAQPIDDFAWRSLPMDNGADDILMGTEFTEIWIPIEHTARAMNLLKDHFAHGGIEASSYYATELYAGKQSDFWLSPGYGGNQFRIDPFWYVNNAGAPDAKGGFFGKLWELFRANDIPFRLHWAKFLPDYEHKQWAEYFRSQYPQWDRFMTMRAEWDPDDVFLTDYWRLHLFGEVPPS